MRVRRSMVVVYRVIGMLCYKNNARVKFLKKKKVCRVYRFVIPTIFETLDYNHPVHTRT